MSAPMVTTAHDRDAAFASEMLDGVGLEISHGAIEQRAVTRLDWGRTSERVVAIPLAQVSHVRAESRRPSYIMLGLIAALALAVSLLGSTMGNVWVASGGVAALVGAIVVAVLLKPLDALVITASSGDRITVQGRGRDVIAAHAALVEACSRAR